MIAIICTVLACVTLIWCTAGIGGIITKVHASHDGPPMDICDRCSALVPADGGVAAGRHDSYHAWMDAMAMELHAKADK